MVVPTVLLEQVRVGRVDVGQLEVGGVGHPGPHLGHLHLRSSDARIEVDPRLGVVGHGVSPRSNFRRRRVRPATRWIMARGDPWRIPSSNDWVEAAATVVSPRRRDTILVHGGIIAMWP